MKAIFSKRFLICMALMTPPAIAISVAGELLDWSYGLSFVALAAVGVIFSLIAIEENPLNWFRPHTPGKGSAKTQPE